jgi:penicillin-binding protein 1A
MQVTRNFLLTREKTYKRKIKEIMLSKRLEGAYSKEHILYLYLNEIYLGSGAYGVEAAARVYFGKHISEVTIAEAALIAGLAPAPSNYSPHKNWDMARVRQGYVLSQMQSEGLITDAQYDIAKVENIRIVKEENPFLKASPHFTEHVRRHLVNKYGHKRVYNEGLRVTTTCDLEMQQSAQQAVASGVLTTDKRIGFRRETVSTLTTNASILKVRQDTEQSLRKLDAFLKDPAGRFPLPPKSSLTVGKVYDAVVLDVKEKWLKIGIGAHDVIVPLKLSTWAYSPNPKRGWRSRRQTSFLTKADGDGDGKKRRLYCSSWRPTRR